MASKHIPAWKRLGLKLKNQPAGGIHPAEPLQAPGQRGSSPSHSQQRSEDEHGPVDSSLIQNGAPRTGTKQLKRKLESEPKQFTDEAVERTKSKRRKSVTFAQDTKPLHGSEGSGTTARPTKLAQISSSRSVNGDRGSGKQAYSNHGSNAHRQDTHQPPYLDYLEQYHHSRSDWKFSKNKQGTLLKHAFDIGRIPPEHGEALGAYVEGLQGSSSRERLQSTAIDILEAADLATTEDLADHVDDGEIERSARDRWRAEALREQLQATRRRLREAQSAAAKESPEFQSRLRRRERAEQILLALAQSSHLNPGPVSSTSSVSAAGQARHIRFGDDKQLDEPATRSEPRAGTRGTRRSKIRTGVPDDDSSSDSDDAALVNKAAAAAADVDADSDSSDESESSEVSSDSDTTDDSSDESSSEEMEPEIKPAPETGLRLNKQAVRELIHKQNGVYNGRRPKPTNRSSGPAKKKRDFDSSRFSRPYT